VALGAIGFAFLLAAPGARALTIGAGGAHPITVTPLWYNGPGLYGIKRNVANDWTASTTNTWVAAAAGTPLQPLSITQVLQLPPIQNPQQPSNSANPQTPPGNPTKTVPFVGDSTWTIQNNTGKALSSPLLVITFVNYAAGYPNVPVALDDGLVDVLKYTNGGQTYLFGAIPLGPMAPGASKSVTIRYIVGGPLPLVEGKYHLPQLGVSGVLDAHFVPEPSTALLVAAGLVAGVAACRRARGAR
jgi:hypothetical protein